MATNYSRIMYKQYMEVMERLGKMESAHLEDRAGIREMQGDIKSLQKTNSVLQEKCDRLETENLDLKEQVEDLTRENLVLRDDNERMKRILNNDSSNSSLPPSTDSNRKGGKPANSYNGRKTTKKKSGGQEGHKGKTLTREDVDKKISEGKFEKRIEIFGDPRSKTYVSRYRIDLDVKATATELRFYADKDGRYHIPEGLQRSMVAYGPNVKAMVAQLYSEGVVSNDRICEFLNSVSGDALELSEGSVYNFCREFSVRCIPETAAIEETLLNEPVLCTDATVMTTDGKQTYIRNVSSQRSVIYYPADSKTIGEMKAMPVLASFSGILVHDHETALYHFGSGHAECNVHAGRYGEKNTQESRNTWSRHMVCFLEGMNTARNRLKEAGVDHFSEEALRNYEERFDAILEEGFGQNRKTKGKIAKQEEMKLLNRLKKYKKNHLLFLHDFRVPYSNNMSERDLRKCKNREKMAGGFRKKEGRQMFCRILSFVETVKRRKKNLFASIVTLFNGKPVISG